MILAIVLTVLLALGILVVAVAGWQARQVTRIEREQQFAAWQVHQVVADAQRKMREAAREHLL